MSSTSAMPPVPAPLARPGHGSIMARMPPTKRWSSADFDAVIAQVAPDVLALLADGVPRTKRTILAALADRHPKDDVKLAIMRLDVTEQLVEKDGRYTLPAREPEPD
jgi:hypothetical protein